ncbi:PLP-dependent transferase [Pelagibius litoralis]|nr:PLP-dependent transferase [Pelagibius litoralis]
MKQDPGGNLAGRSANLARETTLAEPYGGAFASAPPPIVQASLFMFDSYEQLEARFTGESDRAVYSRVDNPTVREFERLMARIEGADVSAAFASGMAAVTAAVFSQVRPGDRIACVRGVYPDTYRLFERVMKPFGVAVSYHPVEAFENDPELLRGVRLAYLESPVSITFDLLDLDKTVAHARRHGAVTAIDNSWATPIHQRPIAHGVDLVIHSASKYISGHSDVVAGVVSGSAAAMQPVIDTQVPLFGAKMAPLDAWLLIRGLRTLDARMERHARSTETLVARLEDHPLVDRVHFARAGAVRSLKGNSGLFSIELNAAVSVRAFCNALTLFRLSVSWGGFESLVFPAAIGKVQKAEGNSMAEFGVPDNLVRLSIGLENAEDLWSDLVSALQQGAAA